MNCINCDENYLRKIFSNCLRESRSTEEGLNRFDRVCSQSGDPRNPLTIALSMSENNCSSCRNYQKYYQEFIDRL